MPLLRRRTPYFEFEVQVRRPYATLQVCEWTIEHHAYRAVQDDERVRYWAQPPEFGGRWFRVVLLEDDDTLHNAFIDRTFKPPKKERP
jgi:hypothetical protein